MLVSGHHVLWGISKINEANDLNLVYKKSPDASDVGCWLLRAVLCSTCLFAKADDRNLHADHRYSLGQSNSRLRCQRMVNAYLRKPVNTSHTGSGAN